MFGLRKRFSTVKPQESVVAELDGVGDDQTETEGLSLSLNDGDTKGAKGGYGYAALEKLEHSLSSISDGDVSQTSEETDGEEAVPLAVKEGRKNGHVLQSGELENDTNIDIKRTTSPEILADGDDAEAQSELGENKRTRPSYRARRSTGGNWSRRDSTSSTSWLGLDISIIIALVSPIGNLLTGGDHVKNLLLLLLLIYYLHQLVEVPWTLYRMSIPKQSPRPEDDRDEEGKRSPKHAVHNELRALELCYLILTVLSPFLGATLLRSVATSISGDKSTLSWFSTTLFVLATGIRPWSHLVERLKDRSEALNSILDEMEDTPETKSEVQGEHDEKTVQLSGKVDEIRRRLDRMDFRLVDMSNTHMSEWDDLADAIDSVDDGVKKHRAELAKKQESQDARLDALEAYVLGLQYTVRAAPPEPSPLLVYLKGQQLRTLFWELVALPWTIASLLWAAAKRVARDSSQWASANRTKRQSPILSSPPPLKTPTKVKFAAQTQMHTHGHSRLGNGNAAARAPMLEPIMEEEALRLEPEENQPLLAERSTPAYNSTYTSTATNGDSGQTKAQDPPVDPLAYAVAQVVLFVFSPIIIVAKWCVAVGGFPVRVLRALLI